ncbi:prepilin-type N-terminal cleavage/methylation domain-containing protein [Pelagibaculum spongiae]|uniref:Pilus assembly protein n=1 Tax=Pelagibaculum spongiae TaxID=2080658 RepID=A0A2V1GZK5_9GAMM|nr:prepilin-type N-terminal cleavage/methylation domain-containing protein [Pelagibaculum spongiae]PVZ68812.1 hypothetical protein DC094_11175 [Pelagibaculum spongiae]
MKLFKGFTLIEIMITLAVLGILTVIAVPSYQYYISRAKAAEVAVFVSNNKAIIEEFAAVTLRFPLPHNSGIGRIIEKNDLVIESSARLTIDSQGVAKTVIFFSVENQNRYNELFIYVPTLLKSNPGHVVWECRLASVSAQKKPIYAPVECY